jgi:hypothetical protein
MTRKEQTRGDDDGVRGGKHLDGFRTLLKSVIVKNGMPPESIHEGALTLPGFYRPTKEWDIVVVHRRRLVAAVEFKSQVGSLGRNFNNRAEEAIGNAVDFWAAFDAGAFGPQRPWLGWVMFFEDSEDAAKVIRNVSQPHFSILPEFQDASYAKRYELLLRALVRKNLFDSAALLLSVKNTSNYREPAVDIGMGQFLDALGARVRSALQR